MSTTISILQYLWDSPQLQEAFIDFAEKVHKPRPTVASTFQDMTASLSRAGIVWCDVDENGQFIWVLHTREDWNMVLEAMNQSIADRVSKRLLEDL